MGEWGIGRVTRILLVIIFLIVLIFSGKRLFADTKEVVVNVLPGGEDLLNKLIPEKPPSRELEETQADEIYSVIKKTLDKMEKGEDCIEEIDFSDVDKEFILEFNRIEDGTNLLVYKISNDRQELIFDYGFKEIISFIKFNPDKLGRGELLDVFEEFKIVDNFRKVSFNEEKEKIRQFLYKNKWGFISFLAEDDYLDDYLHLDEKSICSEE